MMNITLNLTLEETNGVLRILGELPTKHGAWPLLLKIQGQAEAQTNPQPAPAAPVEAVETVPDAP